MLGLLKLYVCVRARVRVRVFEQTGTWLCLPLCAFPGKFCSLPTRQYACFSSSTPVRRQDLTCVCVYVCERASVRALVCQFESHLFICLTLFSRIDPPRKQAAVDARALPF